MQLNKESLADQIRKELQDRIINVEIEQGEKINVAQLEDEFGVSRAPVREALKSLVDQGIVEVKPRVGYFAIELTPKQIKDICEMRKLLEIYALENSITKISPSMLEKLHTESLKLKNNQVSEGQLRERFDSTDERLHSEIINKADNSILRDFTGRINNFISLTRHLNERIEEAIEEHIAILKGIHDRDEKRAKIALTEHLNNVEEEILKNYEY